MPGNATGVSLSQERIFERRTRLVAERHQRGWSQQDVADHVGTTPLNVSRWERGLTTPTAYFRHKLSMLFQRNAVDLGLIGEIVPDDASSVALADQETEELCCDIALPTPKTATHLSERESEMHHLKQVLLSAKTVQSLAISGFPGVGKTTLALELAYDQEIQAHFDGGVLWASLGPSASLLDALRHWGEVLHLPAREAAQLRSVDAWMNALRVLIGQRRFLFLLDDAWSIEDALLCKVGGPHCSYIVTTRLPQVAHAFATGGVCVLHELDLEQSRDVLQRLAPTVLTFNPEGVDDVIRAVGGNPLALTLLGNYLRLEGYSQQPRRIQAALARLRQAEERLRLAELPYSPRYDSTGLAIPVSLKATLAESVVRLPPPVQNALRALATLPVKPESFSEEDALLHCGVPVEMLDALSDAGLLEGSVSGRYTLPPLLAEYAHYTLEAAYV